MVKTKTKTKEKKIFKSKVSFSKIILDNFKGYGKHTDVHLCPGVNLIYGKNSAGKSSIIQSLRLIRQNLLVVNTPVPFVPIATKIGLQGTIQFPEGIDGILYAKDKKRELKLGLELITHIENKNEINKRCLTHSFKVAPKNSVARADLKSIGMSFTKYSKEKKLLETDLKINLKKQNSFNPKSSFAKFLEEVSEFSGPLSKSELGFKFNNNEESIIDQNYIYEDASIEKLQISATKIVYDDINKDMEKNRKKIIKYLKAVYLETSLKKQKNETIDQFKINRERESTVVEISRIKKLLTFVKSDNFKNYEYFNDFLVNDILSFTKLARFQDQLIDKAGYQKLVEKEKKKKAKSFWIQPDSYLINILDTCIQPRPSFMPLFNFNNLYNTYLTKIRSNLDSIVVIPGLRALPERYHKRGVQSSYVGEQGENIGELIHVPKARILVNKWFKILEIPYEIRSSLKENYFYLELRPIGEKYWISYRDVGLGYSLSLSFILTCLLEKNKTILVEEPEVHLHPKLQGEMMDLLLFSAKDNGNQLIVETHSENMLLRAQKCIRRGHTDLNPGKKKIEINNEDLGINNVFRENNSSAIQKIEIDNKGDFRTHWRDGFFSEKLDELF